MKYKSAVSIYILIFLLYSTKTMIGQGYETAFPRGERSSCVLGAENGCYLAGADDSSKLNLHRVNDSGALLWTKTYGVSGMVVGTYPSDIIYTPEKDILIVGSYWPGSGIRYLYILKIDTLGNTIWEKFFSISQADEIIGKKAAISPDGYYLITGTRTLANQYDIVLVKMDSAGNFIWNKLYNDARDDVKDIVITSSNDYFICGNVGYSPTGDSTYAFLSKIDSSGTVQWRKIYGEMDKNSFQAMHLASDSQIILAGYTQNDSNYWENYWLVKANLNGDTIWQRKIFSMNREMPISMTEVNNKYYLAGFSQYGMIKEIDTSGNLIWSQIYPNASYFTDITGDITNNYFLGCGSTYSFGNNCLYLTKLHLNGTLSYTNDFKTDLNINIYPNPSKEIISVQTDFEKEILIIIYDQSLSVIHIESVKSGKQLTSFDVSTIQSGLYQLTIVDKNNSKIIKMNKIIITH